MKKQDVMEAMRETVYLHEGDASIQRDELKGVAILWDCDGERRFAFPLSMTDDQIMIALRFANKAYNTGFKSGEHNKLMQLRSVLGIER